MGYPVVITSASGISSLGLGMARHREALACGRVALSREHRFAALVDAPLGVVDFAALCGESAASLGTDALYWAMASRVIADIADQSDLFARYRPEEIGVFLGTTTYGVAASIGAAAGTDLVEYSRRLRRDMNNGAIIGRIRQHFPIRGTCLCFTNSCASSAMAIGEACKALSAGLFPVVLAGGFDVLTPVSIMGFDALQVLNHDYSEPMTARTEGINLAEGGGFLLLEREDLAANVPQGRIIGYAAGNEAFHPVKPNPDGSGILRVMREALARAGVGAEAISYLNAHGTGTSSNDLSECAAIRALFGKRAIFHSTKRWHGHTLGASGAIEALICLIALEQMDDWCLRYGLAAPVQPEGLAMSNSFGFGGANACLILGR